MPVPDYQTLMLPVLQSTRQGERRISEVVEQLANEFSLTPQERSELLPSGRQSKFANRVHWAKTYLTKAGLLESTRRGHFALTQRGKELLANPPERIDREYLTRFPEFQEFVHGQKEAEEAASGRGSDFPPQAHEETRNLTPDEVMRQAHQELESTLAGDLLQRVRAASPAFFEVLVVRLLVAMGYGGESVVDMEKALVGGSGDGGVDGVIDQDPLGLDRIYLQAKRYAENNSVGPGAIRDFFGSLDRFKANKGLFLTTSDFTAQARQTAEMLSKRIVLVSGNQLARLMIRHGIGCRVEETLVIRSLDEEFFG